MLLETFSLRYIVESGKYARGSSDSRPGFQALYSVVGDLMACATSFVLGLYGQRCEITPSEAGLKVWP